MIWIWLAWIFIVGFSGWALWMLRDAAAPHYCTAHLIVYGLSFVAGMLGFLRFAWKRLKT